MRGSAWKLLAHALSAALGRKLPETQDAAALAAECEAALGSVTGEGARLLVVLDGLDEAVDWEAGRDLNLAGAGQSPRVKVLVSARSTPQRDGDAWRQRLGVPAERCHSTRNHEK